MKKFIEKYDIVNAIYTLLVWLILIAFSILTEYLLDF